VRGVERCAPATFCDSIADTHLSTYAYAHTYFYTDTNTDTYDYA
jgi:hypothetical protein